MEIPQRFLERYGKIAGDMDALLESLKSPLPRAFRVNTIKASPDAVSERFRGYGIGLKGVPWYSDAFISDNPNIGKTLEHFMGHIYMQELASMIPPLLIREELKEADYVLDACAAPGSKTTQLAAMMENRGTLVANDIDYGRLKALKFNLEKSCGLNVVMVNQDLRFFPKSQFDAILLDAPCSAEGTSRKNPDVFPKWSEANIRKQASMQRQLILKAFDLLAPGGVMVYSTCTYAPEENEAVIDYLLRNRAAKLEKASMPKFRMAPGVLEWEGRGFDREVKKAGRVWPHLNDTGGFFLAKVRK
jgi:NOL1/NOP2/sun family putative RNA methylase